MTQLPGPVPDGPVQLTRDPSPPPSNAERIRRGLAPVVATLSSALAVLCVVNLADIVFQVEELHVVNARFAGWAGVGGLTSVAVAAAALLAAPRLGAGLPLAVGAAGAVLGLALGRSIVGEAQLAFALVVLGIGVGGLLGGAACIPGEVPPKQRSASVVAYGLPLVAGFPLVSWLALHFPAAENVRLSLHPPVWPLAVVSVVIVAWSAVSLLLEPAREDLPGGRTSWDTAWTSLVIASVVPIMAAILLGFDPGIGLEWLRPLIVLSSALAVVGLVLTAFAVPTPSARLGYVAVVVVMLCWPTDVGMLLVTADAGATRVPALNIAVLIGLAAAGGALGWWRPAQGVVAGLLVVAAAAAGGWAAPRDPWLMLAVGGPMAVGVGAALLGGLRCAAAELTGARFIGVALVSTIVVGSLLAMPLTWALAGNVPDATEEARAALRVLAGLTFALVVLAAAYSATLARHLREGGQAPLRRVTSETDVTIA